MKVAFVLFLQRSHFITTIFKDLRTELVYFAINADPAIELMAQKKQTPHTTKISTLKSIICKQT